PCVKSGITRRRRTRRRPPVDWSSRSSAIAAASTPHTKRRSRTDRPDNCASWRGLDIDEGEWRSERWEGASKARGREQFHREALEYRVNGGASAGKAQAKPEGESSFTAKPSNTG